MFELEISHTFRVSEWSCPVTRIVDLDFVERAIREGSRQTFMCSIPGCHHEGRAVEMRNLDRARTEGVVVIVCQEHAREFEARGHRTFWLDRTLGHAVRGYRAIVEATVELALANAANSRPRTHFGRALQEACRQHLAVNRSGSRLTEVA